MLGHIGPWSWLVVFTISYVVFMAPAYAAGWWLKERLRLDESVLPLAGVVVVSLAGYFNVGMYFLNPRLGIIASGVFIVMAFATCVAIARRPAWRDSHLRTPALLVYLVGVLYLSILYVPGDIGSGRRFFMLRPPDNILPQLFAEHLYYGSGLRDIVAGYHGSDRPPLQSGLQLLSRPLAALLGLRDVFYQCAGTVAQLSWIFALSALCARANIPARGRAIALTLAIFSGYFLYNSVYIWPKLLAAALSIAFALFFWDGMRNRSTGLIALAAAAGAAAFLSHGGSAFFLIPLGVTIAVTMLSGNVFSLVVATGIGVVLVAPWSLYQHFYDPPGDRLIKMHIAGISAPGPPDALRAIENRYLSTAPATIFSNKISNLQMAFFWGELRENATAGEPRSVVNDWRLYEREYIFAALDWANLGWFFVMRTVLLRRATRLSTYPLLLVAGAAASLVFWSIVTWGPNETVVTHSAYAVDVLLFAALGIVIAGAPRWLAGLIVAAQCCDFFVVWVLGTAHDAASEGSGTSYVALALAVASTVAIVLTLYRFQEVAADYTAQ